MGEEIKVDSKPAKLFGNDAKSALNDNVVKLQHVPKIWMVNLKLMFSVFYFKENLVYFFSFGAAKTTNTNTKAVQV